MTATRAELAGLIERHQDAADELRRSIAWTVAAASEIRHGGIVALDLERAQIAIATALRCLDRAQREAER